MVAEQTDKARSNPVDMSYIVVYIYRVCPITCNSQ